ncbi:helix-turn-helix domain-containing protein [Neobacillus drentensis]|uniref:helix-turn-helix domain-containing protein n=1 Tax=Neobacillus drentensis TaxID=220684 RepID=UPI0030008BDC
MKKEKALYIGEALKPLQLATGMSQEELAHRCKLDRSYMSDLETNKKSPSFATIIKIAMGLGVKPEELVGEMVKPLITYVSSKKSLKNNNEYNLAKLRKVRVKSALTFSISIFKRILGTGT